MISYEFLRVAIREKVFLKRLEWKNRAIVAKEATICRLEW